MKKFFVIAVFTIAIFITSCIGIDKNQIVMSTNKTDNVEIGLSGSWGVATIDWGDGTRIKSRGLWSLPIYFSHNYLYNNKIWDYQTIYIGGNPGADSCNHSIATNKGWEVDTQRIK